MRIRGRPSGREGGREGGRGEEGRGGREGGRGGGKPIAGCVLEGEAHLRADGGGALELESVAARSSSSRSGAESTSDADKRQACTRACEADKRRPTRSVDVQTQPNARHRRARASDSQTNADKRRKAQINARRKHACSTRVQTNARRRHTNADKRKTATRMGRESAGWRRTRAWS